MDKENDPFAYCSAPGGGGGIPYTVVPDADGIIRQTFTGAISYKTPVSAIEACK